MAESIKEILLPEEPRIDTAKRLGGAGLMMLVALPISNKQGWTIPAVLVVSDALGLHMRAGLDRVSGIIKGNEVGSSESPVPPISFEYNQAD